MKDKRQQSQTSQDQEEAELPEIVGIVEGQDLIRLLKDYFDQHPEKERPSSRLLQPEGNQEGGNNA